MEQRQLLQEKDRQQALAKWQKQQDSLRYVQQQVAYKNEADAIRNSNATVNETYTSTATQAIGVASTLKDNWVSSPGYLRFTFGLAYESIPLIVNGNNNYTSRTTTTSPYSFQIGLPFGILNNLPISFHFNPYLLLGWNVFQTGYSGTYSTVGIDGQMYLSTSNTSLLKLFLEGGYQNRQGNYTYNEDAQMIIQQILLALKKPELIIIHLCVMEAALCLIGFPHMQKKKYI